MTFDTIEQKPAEEEVRRQEAILAAVAFTAQRLLSAESAEEAIQEALSSMGRAAGVDRAVIFVNHQSEEGPAASIQHEWVSPGIPSIVDNPRFKDVPRLVGFFERWEPILRRGGAVFGGVRDFPPSERALLEEQGVRSLAAVPIFAGGDWWGHLGVSSLTTDHQWSAGEIGALRAAAGIIGAAIRQERAEEARRQSEERYRSLVEHSPDGILMHRLGIIVYANPSAARLFRARSAEDLVGRSTLDLVHSSSQPLVLQRIQQLREGMTVPPVEETLVGLDGSLLTAEVAASPFVYEGDPVVQVVIRDLSDRKRAEAEREGARELLEATLQATADGIMVVDQKGRASYSNARFGEMWRIRPQFLGAESDEDLLSFVLAQLIDPEAFLQKIRQASKSAGESFDILESKDGRVFECYSRSLFRGSTAGGRVWSFRDISEHRRAQEALKLALERERQAADRLRGLDEMKNTFLHAVSHELRTPLSAVLGFALTLEREDIELDPRERRDLAQRLAANARKLEQLLTDLLDLDRLDRGILEPRRRPTDIAALVRRTIESSEVLGARPIRVDASLAVVSVDAPKVERIVENLLANAARHTPPDTTIWVRVTAERDGVLIAVEDTGEGVPEELRESIFEPFQRGPAAAKHAPGVGIGLSLVAKLAELHGGRAWVQERRGGGASFRVFLPGAAAERVAG